MIQFSRCSCHTLLVARCSCAAEPKKQRRTEARLPGRRCTGSALTALSKVISQFLVSGAVSLGVLAFHEGEKKKGNSFFLLLGPLGTFKMKTVCSRWLFDSDSGHIHTGGSNCGIAFISGEKRSKNKCPTISALKITASDAIFLWQLTL